MPAEWSALLHGLDQTLQEMGEQTLDTKDAVFAVNALLMASTEVSQAAPLTTTYSRPTSIELWGFFVTGFPYNELG